MSFYLIESSEAEQLKVIASKLGTVSSELYQSSVKSAKPMTMTRGVAEIDVSGVLEPERVAVYDYWGVDQTSYSDITAQAIQAKNDGAKLIRFNMRSGGGNVEGLLPAMKAIKSLGVPTEAVVTGMCASACYMLASQCDTISSTSELDILGSIGVVTSRFNFEQIKEITNSASPNKRPNTATDEGVKVVESELDDIYDVIIPYVSKSRKMSAEKISSEWGQGGTMTAKTALSVGMIDAIKEKKPAGRSGTAKDMKMDINKLKAEHPDLYASVFAAGKEAGVDEFKQMATVHVELAKLSGDNERALADIASGKAADHVCQVHHTTVATRRAMITEHGEETPDAVGDGKDPQADAAGDDKNKDDVLESEAKAFWGNKVLHV